MIAALRRWAAVLKRDVVALWLAARHPRTPMMAKLIAACVAAYALSPIDLIPDFIPVLGYLDDLVLLPLGIWLAVRLIPPDLMQELRKRAATQGRPGSRAAAAFIVGVWLLALALAGGLVWRSEWVAETLGRTLRP
ncbi:MAG TPA: YkvA family protein [Brevundimonas sp.]|nr:YkvA family protein [Brevundimonas sp.]